MTSWSFTIPGTLTPKIRWGRAKHGGSKADRDRIARYTSSCDRVRRVARPVIPTPWPLRAPVRLGVAAFYARAESGPRKGLMPANPGDWEGVYGTVADALAKGRGLRPILEDDAPPWVIGPCGVLHEGQRIPPGSYCVGRFGVAEPCVLVTVLVDETDAGDRVARGGQRSNPRQGTTR